MAQVQIGIGDNPTVRAVKINAMLAELLNRPLTAAERIPPFGSSAFFTEQIIRTVADAIGTPSSTQLIRWVGARGANTMRLNALFTIGYDGALEGRFVALSWLVNHWGEGKRPS